ncbi:hypothetical protein FPSE_00077 [Fusarium pseudograminearum CS3096]|uniref:Uncharacterized protein n=1 Tax=Fusarium pseudograminearum (strain CS3096) TaxID=1028729 RepID=K3VV66_FUSPC|nr:hypothetical protein FPSE_00077 [Fusarium pseudograminearum CS3096]EKJ79797.1 hypothetical protein FPSE_00077 [Fusarium pseudograminearum CS3096]
MPFDQRIVVSGTKRLKSELGAQRFSYGPVAFREYNVRWYGISSPYGKSQDD